MPRRKTTPAASFSVASHHLISDAATPPCGDARRGIGSPKSGVEFEKFAHPEFLDFRRFEFISVGPTFIDGCALSGLRSQPLTPDHFGTPAASSRLAGPPTPLPNHFI